LFSTKNNCNFFDILHLLQRREETGFREGAPPSRSGTRGAAAAPKAPADCLRQAAAGSARRRRPERQRPGALKNIKIFFSIQGLGQQYRRMVAVKL